MASAQAHRMVASAKDIFKQVSDAMLDSMTADLDGRRTRKGGLTEEEALTYEAIDIERTSRKLKREREAVRAMTTRAIVDELSPIADMLGDYDDTPTVDRRRELLTNELTARYKVADDIEEAWAFSELTPEDHGPVNDIIAAVTAYITDGWDFTRA